jgi:hypothetical protein
VEATIKQELSCNPSRTYPPVNLDGNLPVTYVESQPLPIGDENYLCNLREVKVKVTDLGVCRFSFVVLILMVCHLIRRFCP